MGFSRYYKLKFRQNKKSSYILLIRPIYYSVIFQTPKHVQDMFDFNITSNLYGYLALFVPKTLPVVWYFIINLIPLQLFHFIWVKIHSHIYLFLLFNYLLQTPQIYSDFTWSFPLSKSELLCSVLLIKLSQNKLLTYLWYLNLKCTLRGLRVI